MSGTPAPRVVDEHAAHHLGGDTEEVHHGSGAGGEGKKQAESVHGEQAVENVGAATTDDLARAQEHLFRGEVLARQPIVFNLDVCTGVAANHSARFGQDETSAVDIKPSSLTVIADSALLLILLSGMILVDPFTAFGSIIFSIFIGSIEIGRAHV